MTTRALRLAITLSILAFFLVFSSARLASRGKWLPPLPSRIGDWDVTEVPLSEEDLGVLGKPPASGFELLNPLQERIYGRIVATRTYDAFQLPSILPRFYEMTAEKTLVLPGSSEKVLAQIYRQQGSELRIGMISWVQKPDGSISLLGLSSGAGRSVFGRVIQGSDGVFRENRTCVVRLYTIFHPADPQGAQGRRNLISASVSLRKGLLSRGQEQGSSASILEPQIAEGGKDMNYLSTAVPSKDTVDGKTALLPLKQGNSWEFSVQGAEKPIAEQVVVTGPVTVRGQVGMRCEIRRAGRVWRQEIYRETPTGIELLAFGDASQNKIEIDPPLSLLRYPLKDGEEERWKGKLTVRGKVLRATGYSRISARENIVAPAGRFVSYRIDTVLTIPNATTPTHFPSIRWLASGIGFVRRGYADTGKPAVAELKRFSVKS
jgi:hypothetical protein